MFNTGVALDDDLVVRHPELLTGWPRIEPKRTASAAGAANPAAIVVHIYYEDAWPDIAEVLKRLTIPYDLIVTTVPGREGLAQEIRRDFPEAGMRSWKIADAMSALSSRSWKTGGSIDIDMSAKCTARNRRTAGACPTWVCYGAGGSCSTFSARREWPRDARAFRTRAGRWDDRLRRVPPAEQDIFRGSFLGPEPRHGPRLRRQNGGGPETFRLDFFGGTMFWVRPEALRPLRDLRLSSAFPDEQGRHDGALEHAAERLFATSVVAAGYHLADSDGASGAGAADEADYALRPGPAVGY